MGFVIYSYGGGDLLYSIFNAIGMLFENDNKYLTPVAGWAMMFTVIYIGCRSIVQINLPSFIGAYKVPFLIFMLCFSAKAPVWIKDDVEKNAPMKVDNIPFGIAVTVSLASGISHSLSQLLEEVMMPVNALPPSQIGLLYGAKAVGKARDIQIQDPILLRNAKEYMRQCYMIPYVIGNFGGKRIPATKEKDLLDWLSQNPAKCFGMRFTNTNDGTSSFMTCTAASKIITKEIKTEASSPILIRKFASILGIPGKDENLISRQLKLMTEDVFTQLEQGHVSFNNMVQQAMILNANRESFDDLREKYDLPRLYPEIIKMQATRGLMQQGLGSIIGGEMSQALIPSSVQPVVLALVVMLFVIALPLMLLPGGMSTFVNGLKMIVWVCSWPVFYTVIHAISMILIKKAIVNGGWDGLSMLNQTGFTEVVLMKYATAQSLISAVPFISFAIVFGSPYALSGIASGLASVSASSGLGSSLADGNVSMKQSSYDNASHHQQNLAPSLSMGKGIIDDGAIRTQTNSDGGQVITEYSDQLVNNINSSDSLINSTTSSLNEAKSDMSSLTDRESTIDSAVNSKSIDLAKSVATGQSSITGLSESSQNALRDSFTKGESLQEGESVNDSKTTGSNSELGVDSGKSLVGKAASAALGIKGSTKKTAANTIDVRSDLSKSEQKAFNSALDEVKQLTSEGRFSSSSSEDNRLADSMRADMSTQKQIAQDKAITAQKIETYSHQLSYIDQNSAAINRNLNEPFLQKIIETVPEVHNKAEAARWAKTHQPESGEIVKQLLKDNSKFNQGMSDSWKGTAQATNTPVGNVQIANESVLQKNYKEEKAKIVEEAKIGEIPMDKMVRKNIDSVMKKIAVVKAEFKNTTNEKGELVPGENLQHLVDGAPGGLGGVYQNQTEVQKDSLKKQRDEKGSYGAAQYTTIRLLKEAGMDVFEENKSYYNSTWNGLKTSVNYITGSGNKENKDGEKNE